MAAIIILSIGIVSAGGTCVGLAIRNGVLGKDKIRLGASLGESEKERNETRAEFKRYRETTAAQMEGLRDELTDLEDVFATCTDPAVIHDHFDRVLSKAAARPNGDPSSD